VTKKNAQASPVITFIVPAMICAFALSVLSCSGKKAEWKSPADAKELSLLENKTLENFKKTARRTFLSLGAGTRRFCAKRYGERGHERF